MRLLLFIMIIFFLVSCQQDKETVKKIDLYNSSGDMIGTANLSEIPEGVQIKLKLEGLSPGFHGIHIHEYPKCEGPDFLTAGNHFNPDGKEHGLMHPEGPHLGDLPNIKADSDGLVDNELLLSDTTLLEGKKSILQGEGTSIVITSEKDDGVSQPGGDSGPRIICGKITTKSETDQIDSPTDPTQFNEKQEE